MTQFTIINLSEVRETRRREVARQEAIIAARKHNQDVINRYLSMFGKCLPGHRVAELRRHLSDIACTLPEMRVMLHDLKNSPLY